MQAAALLTAHDVHRLTIAGDFAQRVLIRVVHRRGGGHGRWVKGLYLVGPKAVFFQPLCQVHHVFVAGTRVGSDKVRNQKLLFTGFQAVLFKQLFELVVAANTRLHHLRQRALLGVLRRDFQIAADVVRHQFFHIFRTLYRQVVAQARADQNLFHTLERPRAAVHFDQRIVVGIQVGANTGVNT